MIRTQGTFSIFLLFKIQLLMDNPTKIVIERLNSSMAHPEMQKSEAKLKQRYS